MCLAKTKFLDQKKRVGLHTSGITCRSCHNRLADNNRRTTSDENVR